ncbi:DNA polymerase delta subunit 4 [Cladophialophora carrionii]|uniref:DNA polymerase delta subunit 4 n=1 Tax=Cladophialophora carrionii TaxID=86049 RepID=A0A1C1C9U4_9EURO|nr:DNA polymerase delta subunit 4 [Cladophialophora carrionii]
MPRGRKSATARASSGGQSRLSFNNRVTKTSAQAQRDEEVASAKKISQIEDSLQQEQPEPEVVDVAVKDEPELGPTQQKIENNEQQETEQIVEEEPEPSKASARRRVKAVKGKDEREIAAEKITDAQLRKYWQKEEDSRLAPRVHQETLPLHEKILRHFDLSSQYGPCIGVPRLTRWRRANTLGLQPPIEVLAVLLREEEGGDAKEEMHYGRKGRSQGCGKMAYIDELGSGRVVLVE